MNPVEKALWYIESHFGSPISLDDIAGCAGVSRFHLLRSFNAATGRSIMRYVRGRRLAVAAQSLADGAEDILSVAIAAGYGSHEAFTRAFRDQFGVTPETTRAQGHLRDLALLEAIKMDTAKRVDIPPPRLVDGEVLLVAGLSERYGGDDSVARIPLQWQRFTSYLGSIKGQVGQVTYGVCYNSDDEGNMDYLSGVQVTDFSSLPPEFSRVRVPVQRYAVFRHGEHISAVRGTWNAIWNDWLPQSAHEAADAPLLERYDERFDPSSGYGGVELWVPVRSRSQ